MEVFIKKLNLHSKGCSFCPFIPISRNLSPNYYFKLIIQVICPMRLICYVALCLVYYYFYRWIIFFAFYLGFMKKAFTIFLLPFFTFSLLFLCSQLFFLIFQLSFLISQLNLVNLDNLAII